MSDAIQAILFDFDGVICNSEPLHCRAFQETLAIEKIDLSEDEYYREMIGFDDRGAFKHIFAHRKRELDEKTFARVLASKEKRTMDLIRKGDYQALTGVDAFVRGLAKNYPLGICSGARREEIEAMLEGVKLRQCFPVIVAAQDVPVGKPDPSGYKLATRLLAENSKKTLDPKQVLVIEDAPTVIATCRDVGFVVLGVATSYPIEKLSHANYAVKTLTPAEVLAKIPGLRVA